MYLEGFARNWAAGRCGAGGLDAPVASLFCIAFSFAPRHDTLSSGSAAILVFKSPPSLGDIWGERENRGSSHKRTQTGEAHLLRRRGKMGGRLALLLMGCEKGPRCLTGICNYTTETTNSGCTIRIVFLEFVQRKLSLRALFT